MAQNTRPEQLQKGYQKQKQKKFLQISRMTPQ